MTKKYLLINKVETVQKVITGWQKKKSGIPVPDEYKNYVPDVIEKDGFLWIALDDLLTVFPMSISWWLNNANLEVYKRIEKELGVFPIMEQ